MVPESKKLTIQIAFKRITALSIITAQGGGTECLCSHQFWTITIGLPPSESPEADMKHPVKGSGAFRLAHKELCTKRG